MDENLTKTNADVSPTTQKRDKKSWLKDLLWFVGIIVFVVIPFRMYVAQPYLVDGSSMDPTFKNGEYLIVDEISYRFEEPKRGDVIVFRFPLDPKQFFIKRIIGLPGETIELSSQGIKIINKENPEGEKLNEPYVVFDKKDTLIYKLKNDQYFAMGDNRVASADSRIWGPVPRENIVGKPIFSLFPISKIAFRPGALDKFTK